MKKRNFLAVLASCAVVAGMFPMTASAVNYKYTPVAGGTTTFDKYLVMDENANVPKVSFEYTVAAGTAKTFDATNQTIAIYAGPTPEKIAFTGTDISDETKTDSKFEIRFEPGNSATAFADKAATDYVKNLDASEKYAKKTVTLDFSKVEFDEPGIYRYIITETKGTEQAITYDSDNTRVLDVYVTDNNGTLKVSEYILHATESTVTINGTTYGSDGNVISTATAQTKGNVASDYKSQGFTNEYTSYDFTFSKTVTGNQGSKDKYFEFTLKITGAAKDTVYDISYADDNNANTTDGAADVSINANPNSATTVITADVTQPATITVGADGTVTQVFYLQNGQKIAVRGLAEGTKYTIVDGKEDYVAAYVTDDAKDKTNEKTDTAKNDTGIDQDVNIDFTNTREGVIPTGVILSVAAPVVIGLAVLGGIVFLVIKNKKRDDEEEE